MELVHEFTLHFALGESLQMGAGPFGARAVGVVGDGWVKGARISGRLVGPAADWAIIGSDGYAEVDVRAQIRTPPPIWAGSSPDAARATPSSGSV